jgi:proteasome accessory factor C
MLPYAIQHPGVTVDELAHKFGVRRREIVDDLELVFLCGLPGYGPGDLIDVSVNDDRVFVRMADYFSEPLHLSPAEGLSLYAAGRVLVDLPEMEGADALRRALAKLGRALGLGDEEDGAISLRLQPGPTEHVARLRTALREKRRTRLEYLSASRGELSEREVEPWGLILAWGRSYLVGWDHLSRDERVFRIDRIKAVDVLDAPAEVPEDFDPQRYRTAFVERPDERTISLEISPAVARWFADYYPVKAVTELDDGWRRIEMATQSDRWAATLLLRLGAGARAVDPPSIGAEARSLARRLAQSHAAAGAS